MGWFDIAFSQPFIVVLVLLIGLSIDYGLHVVMRYREARESSETAPSRAMAVALGSVGVALVYVTTTTVIGFLSNLTSPLGVFPRTRRRQRHRDRGHAARLRPARSGVESRTLDELLERRGIDRLKPAIGTGSGPVNRLLVRGQRSRRRPPIRRHRRRAPRQRDGCVRSDRYRR